MFVITGSLVGGLFEGAHTDVRYDEQLGQYQGLYAQLAADMIAKGWQPVWATRNRQGEWTPLPGTTGGRSEFPSSRPMPQGELARIAFRPPESVKILDVDHYGDKLGAHTIERAEEELGVLPPTWRVTSRGPGDRGGRLLYRYDGIHDFKDSALRAFADPDTGATFVEIVRTSHRFSWAPYDVNPKVFDPAVIGSGVVQCYDPLGRPCALPPVDQLPWLPAEWTDYLSDPPRIALPQLPVIDTDGTTEWWLHIPDSSVGTRSTLGSLAFEMMKSGADVDLVRAQLRRISVALDVGRPWREEDFAALTDGNTQEKVARTRGEWAAQRLFLVKMLPGGEAALDRAVDQAERDHQRHMALALFPKATDEVPLLPPEPTPATPMPDLSGLALSQRFEVDEDTGAIRPRHGASDVGLATDLIERCFTHVRFASDAGHWLINQGHAWEDFGNKSEAPSRAKSLAFSYGQQLERLAADQMAKPAKGEEDPAEPWVKMLRSAHAKLTSNSGAGAVGAAAASIASGNPGTCVRVADLDTEPHILWAGGIPWDLRASLRQPVPASAGSYSPVHRMTAAYVPDITVPTPMWDLYLSEVWPDPALAAYAIREIAGAGLWGETSKQHPVLDGKPSSGKSTVAQQIVRILGSYAVQVSPSKLLTGRADSTAEEEMSRLIGARLAWMDEPPPPRKQAVSEFNELASGTGTISASAKYKNVVTARKLFNFVVCQNPRNRLQLGAEGVTERIVFIPCPGIPARTAHARHLMLAAFEQEAPGILARLITECAQFRAGARLPVPEPARAAQEEASVSMDEWAEAFMDMFEEDDSSKAVRNWMTLSAIKNAVNGVCRHQQATQQDMEDRMRKLGFDVRVGQKQKRACVKYRAMAFR